MARPPPSEDAAAPKGDIVPVRRALQRFATKLGLAADGLPFAGPAGLDAWFVAVAKRFNRTRDKPLAPRKTEMIAAVEKAESAARAYARALTNLPEAALAMIVDEGIKRRSSPMMRSFLVSVDGAPLPPASVPEDDFAAAFAHEIETRPNDNAHEIETRPNDNRRGSSHQGRRARRCVTAERSLHREFMAPTIARAEAIGRLATQARERLDKLPPDKGGPRNLLTQGRAPEWRLIVDCFRIIVNCFGEERARKTSKTASGPFADFAAAMLTYALGDGAPDSLGNALDVLPLLKDELARRRPAGPVHFLFVDQITRDDPKGTPRRRR